MSVYCSKRIFIHTTFVSLKPLSELASFFSGAEAVPPVTTTEPVAETVVAVTGEAGGHLAGQPQGQLQGTGHIQGKGDKMLRQSPSQTHILILFPVIRRME